MGATGLSGIPVDAPDNILEPLPYHVELRDYLKSHERELWNWFASARAQADYTGNLRLDLLKSTYRLDAEGHPELFRSVEEAKARLHLDIPVTLYQAQNNHQINAALYFIPGEGHIVFCGPIHTLLNAEELKSVIGHELAHYHLWIRDDGEFHIADRLIHAVANDPRAAASHEQSARRFQLYTEIFADRGSLQVTGDANPVVAGLVKIETGLSQVSASSYLKQAREIFANGNHSTEGHSHPETFIRTHALSLWGELRENAATEISEMIEGRSGFEELDLVGQQRLTAATRRLLEHLLRPKWFQTPATLGHAKLFFADFQPASGNAAFSLDGLECNDDAKLREYLCFVLLDFAKADHELDDLPLAAALELSGHLNIEAQFEKIATKELAMKIRDLRKLKEQAREMLTRAEVAG
jgi:hypothetical protein